MLKMILKFVVFTFLVCGGINVFSYAQNSGISNENESLANTKIENVRIETQSIEQLFTELSLSYNIPIGLEIASNDDELITYSVDFKKETLSSLLTQIVFLINKNENQYTWEIKNEVVNIFPKNNYRDVILDSLLETKINNLSVKEKTNSWTFVETLVATPEIKKVLETNGMTYRKRSFTGFYIPQLGRNFTLNASDTSLKSILNKVIKESPTAKFWVIKRNSYDPQTFFITLNARHEDSPMRNSKFSFPKINF